MSGDSRRFLGQCGLAPHPRAGRGLRRSVAARLRGGNRVIEQSARALRISGCAMRAAPQVLWIVVLVEGKNA